MHVFFLIFHQVYINLISLYQFINLFKRFDNYIFYLNLLLDKINSILSVNYLVFYIVYLRPGIYLINK